MPSVYTFSRSDNEILQELLRVFSSGRGTAREQWSLQAELLVEPVGWDALWKLSKEFCKKFEVRFPCIAYVSVTSVDFEALSACVDVLSVQHENVSLPETVEDVPLIELWPTVKQREKCINVASTAEFIDLLRFYYNDIWMPWDDQDDKVLLPNTIEDRMSLWSDLHNGTIPNCVARSISLLRSSAINAHDKLKELDSSLCEGDLADEDDSLLPPNYISLCAEMNARLDGLMSKWTLYENPLIREQYLAKAKNRWQKHKNKKNVTALWQGGSIFEFDEISKFLKSRITNNQTLTVMVSAEEALALEPEELVICSKNYELPEMPLSQISICSYKGATLQASDMRSCLLMLSDDCSLTSLQLHCALVNTLLLMRNGTLRIRHCSLLDDSQHSQSDFAQAIVAMSGAKILIEDCTFDNFYSGIVVHKGAQVELRNCTLKNCGVGIQMYSGAQVVLKDTAITDCSEQCIRCEVDIATGGKKTESLSEADTPQPRRPKLPAIFWWSDELMQLRAVSFAARRAHYRYSRRRIKDLEENARLYEAMRQTRREYKDAINQAKERAFERLQCHDWDTDRFLKEEQALKEERALKEEQRLREEQDLEKEQALKEKQALKEEQALILEWTGYKLSGIAK